MSEIFDFTNLKNLVDTKKPPAIILVDTNFFIANPEPSNWHTDINDPVFVLTYSTFGEIDKLRSKKKDEAIRLKARKALNALLNVTENCEVDPIIRTG